MIITEVLDQLPIWVIFIFSLVLTFQSIEFGFHRGKRRLGRLTGEQKIRAGPIVNASLSLLAFMIAIVFGAVYSRFNELKHVVLDEANAIGTTFLRADLLPKADRAEVQQQLQDYVNLRIDPVQGGAKEKIEKVIDRSEELQSELWSRAITIAGQQPTPISALFVQSLNELIDMHEKRITIGLHYRLPGTIWIFLYGLAVIAMAMGGCENGLSGSRPLIVITLSAAAAFSMMLVLVIALDRPHQHLSLTTHAVMVDVQENIRRSMQSQP